MDEVSIAIGSTNVSGVKPPFLQPLDDDAASLYAQYYNTGKDDVGTDIDPITRNLCLVALSAVGRCDWASASAGLATARAGIYDWTSPVCCWASVILWGGISAALTNLEVEAFVRELKGASGTWGENGKAKEILWDGVAARLGHTNWTTNSQMPLGAMVFLGTPTNQLYHVALHVGRSLIVGSCAPGLGNPVLNQKVNGMMQLGLKPFTTILPVDAIMEGQKWTYFTNDAFWKGWTLK
jgi:hypothetical protein